MAQNHGGDTALQCSPCCLFSLLRCSDLQVFFTRTVFFSLVDMRKLRKYRGASAKSFVSNMHNEFFPNLKSPPECDDPSTNTPTPLTLLNDTPSLPKNSSAQSFHHHPHAIPAPQLQSKNTPYICATHFNVSQSHFDPTPQKCSDRNVAHMSSGFLDGMPLGEHSGDRGAPQVSI